ncbi:hypothetical protein T4A_13590 [Trichinella pseudospiralis]|uniref:Secreted protein n=1 Tax=Trichinella pseudospiralis TaxID=6337 RepID=A0A0V1DRM5_TRIPS|nr:hypothetical protein T4A_13590 [Trichinella pseudospiralis]
MDGSVMCNVIFLKCVTLLLPNFSCFLNNISAQIISPKLLKTVHSFCLFWCKIIAQAFCHAGCHSSSTTVQDFVEALPLHDKEGSINFCDFPQCSVVPLS